MKAIVIKGFRDKYTSEIHKKGDILTLTKKRYNEILTVGRLVEELKPSTKEGEH